MDLVRRDLLAGVAAGSFLCLPVARAATGTKLDLRIWSGEKTTAITLESAERIPHRLQILRDKHPYRLVLDLTGVRITEAFQKRIQSLQLSDPLIIRIRVGQFTPKTARIVFDLKRDITLQAGTSDPVGNYAHRILLEIAAAEKSKDPQVYEKIPAPEPKHTAPAAPSAPKKEAVPTGPKSEKAAPVKQANQVKQPEPVRKSEQKKPSQPQKPEKPLKATNRTQNKNQKLIVVIDAGHGGEDPGAVGRKRRTYEKNVVLAIARELVSRINKNGQMKGIMTRNRDVFLRLGNRARVAVENRAHIFISIHADAWTNPKARGISVFRLSEGGATSLESRWLAQTQNKSDEIGGGNLSHIKGIYQKKTYNDLLNSFKEEQSALLGEMLLAELRKIAPLHKDKVEGAEFAVLKARGIPSVLIETGFISNPEDEALLRSSRHQARIAEAIYKTLQTILADQSIRKNYMQA